MYKYLIKNMEFNIDYNILTEEECFISVYIKENKQYVYIDETEETVFLADYPWPSRICTFVRILIGWLETLNGNSDKQKMRPKYKSQFDYLDAIKNGYSRNTKEIIVGENYVTFINGYKIPITLMFLPLPVKECLQPLRKSTVNSELYKPILDKKQDE